MATHDKLEQDPGIAGPLGSLALSVVRANAPTLALRAVRWHEELSRLGLVLPFVVVHDVGLLFATPHDRLELGPRASSEALVSGLPRGVELASQYAELVGSMAESEAARRAGQLKMGDDLVVVLLAKLLGTPASRLTVRPAYEARVPFDASLFDRLDEKLPSLFASMPRGFELAALAALVDARLYVLTVADALDVDTLRLLGMLGAEGAAGALAQVDLLAALSSPAANDVVNFSLEILPSVLETKTRTASTTFASAGYAGIGNRGSVDSLVLTELAWDDAELARRMLDDEVLFYTREQAREPSRRLHYLLVDASASMRGDRQVFARGMALATAKKLLLAGDDVAFRFFDSRLYDVQRAQAGKIPTAYVLSFRGERGRNPARVFSELSVDLDLVRAREKRDVVVHLFTHAALYIPRPIVAEVKTKAHLAGVFILPSGGKLDLDYLDLLDASWVVDHETIGEKKARADRAKSILDDVGRREVRA